MKRTRTIVARCIIATLTTIAVVGCGGPEPVASIAQIKALQEALSNIKEAINRANEAVRDRSREVTSEVDRTIADINTVLEDQRKGILKEGDLRLNKIFREANDTLHLVNESAFALESTVSEDANNAMLTAANILNSVPFVSVRPFVAYLYPSKLIPGASSDAQIRVSGFFRHDIAPPKAFAKIGGKEFPLQVDVSAPNNRVIITIKKDVVAASAGQRIPVRISYPIKKGLFGADTENRTFFVSIFPANIVSYRVVSATADPDAVYDLPAVDFSNNRETGKCSTNEDDFTKSFNDLSGGFDFSSIYEAYPKSRIRSAQITVSQGSNPDGQNNSSVSIDGAGSKAVLHQKARGSCDHGCPFSCRWGEGGNKFDSVRVTLQLQRKAPPVSWSLTGAPQSGVVTWGGEVDLLPDRQKELRSLVFELVDQSYDPPVTRRLSLLDSYDSGIVRAEATSGGVKLFVRSVRRQ